MIGYSAFLKLILSWNNMTDAIKEIQQKILAFIIKIYHEQTKGSLTFLNVGGNYPKAPLTLVIWNDVRKQFKYMPEVIFKGKAICSYGKIILYKDKPEIVISNPNQIRIN